MDSDNPTGAGNQQGSHFEGPLALGLTPQRLHAELLAKNRAGLEAYLQGALRDGTYSSAHRTHRIGQNDLGWVEALRVIVEALGHRGWIYREGQSRRYWVLETTAPFLSVTFDASPLVGSSEGLDYVRGYFDAEGGMPKCPHDRLYLQICQKNRPSLAVVRQILEAAGIRCGRLHNPSAAVDPNYWRMYVRAESHADFISAVGSWHPRKRQQMEARMKI